MGTEVEGWCTDEPACESLRAWFEEAEQVCSRFREDSELSRLNRSPHRSVAVSELLYEVLAAADRARESTNGLVDVGVGAGVVEWGYNTTFEKVVALPGPPAPRQTPVWELGSRALNRSPGTLVDLGGIAKGWACDRAVDLGLATVVSAGGDMRSTDPGTTVPIVDPWGNTAVNIQLGAGGLATSSTSRRRWKVGSREVSHVIDPRTMEPIRTPIVSATVVARSAVEAESGTKAVLLHGDDGLAWATEVDWVDLAIVVWQDGSVYATPGTTVAV